jgi:hypothetical protein
MSQLVFCLLLVLGLVACSTRTYVVTPEDARRMNDQQWDIKSPPQGRM